MYKITDYNCEGECQCGNCENKYTHINWFSIEGFDFATLLCEKHWKKLSVGIIDGADGYSWEEENVDEKS